MYAAEAENVAHADAVYDFRRSAAVHLSCEDVIQPFAVIRIQGLHPPALIKPRHDFSYIHSRLHIKVGECHVRVVKASGVLALQPVNHIPDDFFRREYLIGALRGNIIEDVSLPPRLKIVREFGTLSHKFLHCVVEYDLVEQMSVKVPFLAFFRYVIPAVAQHTELVKRHAPTVLRIDRNFPEYLLRHERIEVRERRVLVAVGHEERRYCAGEAAQMVADAALDGILLLGELRGLHSFHCDFHDFFRYLVAAELLADVVHHLTAALETFCRVFVLNPCDFCHLCAGLLRLFNFVFALSHKPVVTNGVIPIFAAHNRVCGFTDFAPQQVLRRFIQIAAILRFRGVYGRISNRARERLFEIF